MSLFIDFPVGFNGDEDQNNIDEDDNTKHDIITTSWCNSESILAVSCKDQGVKFYNEEGDIIEDSTLERNNSDALSVSWRVRSKVIATGWEDGAVTLWNIKDKVIKEDNTCHSSRVSLVEWSPEGGRLLSADSNGTVGVWRTDYRGRLALVAKKDVGNGEQISCFAWMLTANYRDAQRELPSPPQFFFAGTQFGSIVLMNLKGEIMASSRTNASLRSMSWFEEEQTLVVLTEDSSMIQFKYYENSRELEQISKAKLSMSSSGARGGISKAIWTSPGLLATSAPEAMVRFWDIPNDTSYFLSFATTPQMIQVGSDESKNPDSTSRNQSRGGANDVVSDISFNARTRVLAASSTNGKIYLWRFVGESATVIEDKGEEENDPDQENKEGEKDDADKKQSKQKKFKYPTSSASSWETVATLSAIGAPVNSISWSHRESSLAVIMEKRCTIMNETVLHRTLRCDVAALQISAQKILVQRGASSRIETHVGLRIKGIDVNDTHVLVWNQKKAEVYEFQQDTMERISTFPSKSESMALYGETIFHTNGSKLQVSNLHGVSRKDITFSESEGDPRLLHINGKFLAVATTKGFVKVYDVSRREPRPIGSGTRFVEQQRSKTGKNIKTVPIGEIRSIRCNCDGTRVSILSDVVKGQFMCEPDTRIHVWNLDKDELQAYEFGPSRFPLSHFWDNQEPKLLACEAKRIGKSLSSFEQNIAPKSSESLRGSRLRHVADEDEESLSNTNLQQEKDEMNQKSAAEKEKNRLQKIRASRRRKNSSVDMAEIEVVSLFATDERVGVMMQDSFSLDQNLDGLLGVKVPRLFFISKPIDGLPRLKGRTMRDFMGLDSKVDDETKRALIDFSYNLTIGNMDEAYRAVKLIENVSVWENMAHMCVKTRRLDVAEMCMGNMGHARGAAALRESKKEKEVEAQIATVAIQLGLLDDAEKLYIDCGRFDLLNKMLRASGQWTKALEVANSFDRIHLRETHFDYGRHLETVNDFKAAIANYEASGTHRKQVPRMLYEADRIDELETYIQSQCDEKLTQWWGQYCESLGEFDRAIHVYQRAGDELSLVRLYCYMDNMQAAAEIALASSNPAASYHLARQCEQRGDIHEAIQFYSRAARYNHAVRLARENGLDSEIVNLALRASRHTMVEAARYLESKGLFEDAVVLYQKGGNVPRALDLCFRTQLFDLLTNIADSLTLRKPVPRPESATNSGNKKKSLQESNIAIVSERDEYDTTAGSSPEILSRCAEFFIEHNKFDKAVHLYITAGEYETALELCFEQKVHITEEMAETMTLDKCTLTDAVKKNPKQLAKAKAHNERRQKLLEIIAKCCKKQQSFHLATRKYTQAGDRVKAMRCLLRSGDTEKIIFFANHSRNREIYILAANYLQNLDWRNSADILQSIVTFYTKAKAYQQLSAFYDAAGQSEIDDFSDYEKALGAFKEAVKHLGKVKDEALKDELMMSLQQRISLVERFVHARKMDPEDAERICNALLAHPEVGSVIRVGDVFALLIEHQYKGRNFDHAYQLIEKMKSRGVALTPYIDSGVLDNIAKAVGVASFMDDDDDRIGSEEEVEDEIEEDLEWSHK